MKVHFLLSFLFLLPVAAMAQLDYRDFEGSYTLVRKTILEVENAEKVVPLCTQHIIVTFDPNSGMRAELVGLYPSLKVSYHETHLTIDVSRSTFELNALKLNRSENGEHSAYGYFGSVFRPGNPKVHCVYKK